MGAKNVFFLCLLFIFCSNFGLINSSDLAMDNFWQELGKHCKLDTYTLMDVEIRINDGGSAAKDNSSLSAAMLKSLIDKCAEIFEDALLSNQFRKNVEIDQLAKHLLLNAMASDAVFEKFIDTVYVFNDKSELASNLFSSPYLPQVASSLLYLNSKFISRADFDPKFTSTMAYYLRLIQHHKQFHTLSATLKQRVLNTIRRLPTTLHTIYFSSVVNLLNIGHWEYLYAPREIGPNSLQRTAFTWTYSKNQTDPDCAMTLEFNESGNIAFASNYEGVLRFMCVDERDDNAYFWLTQDGNRNTKWWDVEFYDDFLAFREVDSKKLLCSDVPYDDERRMVSIRKQSSDINIPQHCLWAVRSVVKLE